MLRPFSYFQAAWAQTFVDFKLNVVFAVASTLGISSEYNTSSIWEVDISRNSFVIG